MYYKDFNADTPKTRKKIISEQISGKCNITNGNLWEKIHQQNRRKATSKGANAIRDLCKS